LLPFSVFFIQITLNFFWSFLFFKFHLLGWSLVEIVVLWAFILLTIIVFYKISHVAAYLLVPYLLWVSFATLLNATFFRLNG
jgi:tryptophan-rich sensory protein